MADVDLTVFELDRGRAALEKYAAVNRLTVQIYGADGGLVAGPVNRTKLFNLVSLGEGPEIFAECARQCLSQSGPNPAVVIDEQYGMAVVGTPLVLAGAIAGAAVAGYALTAHVSYREVVRLARDRRLALDQVWAVTRKEMPVPRSWLSMRGELLGIIGNTLLSENHRSRQLEETSLRLAEASDTKDRFLAALSHELRTPLTAILGYAALVRKGKLDEAGVRQALEVIERNAKLQTQLIEDLLDVSRIISGSLRLQIRPIALGPVIEAAVANARPVAETKRIRLHLVLHAAATIAGDPVRLQQIVSNLLVNAIKFTPPEGTIEVRLEQSGPEVRVVVHDTGVGIRREFLPYVFERFRQDDAAETRSHGGLGLGLAIVHHLVALHDGSVKAESPGVGQGSTFTVRLPPLVGSERSVLEPVPLTARSAAILDDLPALTGLRVLVVDDDADARDLFTRVLEQCDARVRAVGSAGTALTTLESWRPDVLVSDIAMPDESGYVLIRKIRRLPPERGGTIPALAVTAYAGGDDARLALSAGFQAHRAKPIEPVELAMAVGELAREIWHGEP